MKTIQIAWMLGALTIIASCQQIEEKDYELPAKAVNEEGNPLEGIQVITGRLEIIRGATIPATKPVTTEPVLTDETGTVFLNFKSATGAGGNVTFYQDGYYSTRQRVEWIMPDGFEGKSRKAEVHAILKPIKNPIPMYSYSMLGNIGRYIRIPDLDTDYGYDLLLAKPLPPLGDGETADFIFRVEGSFTDLETNEMTLKIRFPNEHDGVVEFLTPGRQSMHEPHVQGSKLISDYLAPESGYSESLERFSVRFPDAKNNQSDHDCHRNFYFRVRTSVDPQGRIISCHYGKIYGDFHFLSGNVAKGFHASFGWVASYFNPTPNAT